MKKIIWVCTLLVGALTFCACSSSDINEIKDEAKEVLSDEVNEALNELDAIQTNYANGTAPLIEIPVPFAEVLYNNWDMIERESPENAPILLREYVEPSIVYFDYESGYSVKWNKDENSVSVEKTDMEAHEDYKQKAHK